MEQQTIAIKYHTDAIEKLRNEVYENMLSSSQSIQQIEQIRYIQLEK